MKLLKHALICVGGIVVTFILLSAFVEIDVRLFTSSSDPFTRASETAWRFDWLFNPLIVILSSFLIALVSSGKHSLISGIVAVLPFLFLYVASSSFSASSLLFVVGYGFLVLVVNALFSLARKQGVGTK